MIPRYWSTGWKGEIGFYARFRHWVIPPERAILSASSSLRNRSGYEVYAYRVTDLSVIASSSVLSAAHMSSRRHLLATIQPSDSRGIRPRGPPSPSETSFDYPIKLRNSTFSHFPKKSEDRRVVVPVYSSFRRPSCRWGRANKGHP